MFEPSPFDDVEETEADVARRESKRRDQPFQPYTEEELERVMKRAPHTRMVDPYRCAFNLDAPDGIGHGYDPDTYAKYPFRQCRQRLADPTKSRYCYEHASQLGVAFFSPDEAAGLVQAEATSNLLRLVPKAVRTLEDVMEDDEAPAGIRAKAAESILDRTGYGKGLEINVNTTLEVKDPTEVLRERLSALRDAQMEAASRMMLEAEQSAIEARTEIVEAEIVEEPEHKPPAA